MEVLCAGKCQDDPKSVTEIEREGTEALLAQIDLGTCAACVSAFITHDASAQGSQPVQMLEIISSSQECRK